MSGPRVAVLMAVHNDDRFVRGAVDSILGQSFADFLFLVIDDGSTDATPEVLAAIADPRLEVVRQANAGLAAALNRGLAILAERGVQYVARQDGDDVSCRERLARQVGFLDAHPEVAACGANAHYIDLDDRVIGTSVVPSSARLIRWELRRNLRGMIHAATTFRLDALAAVGGYRESFRHGEDFDLFVRLAERFPLANLPDFLYRIRLDPGSLSVAAQERNTLYCRWALDGAERRRRGRAERSFAAFAAGMTACDRVGLARERVVLAWWRRSMTRGRGWALAAALLDPKRALARLLRAGERRLQGGAG